MSLDRIATSVVIRIKTVSIWERKKKTKTKHYSQSFWLYCAFYVFKVKYNGVIRLWFSRHFIEQFYLISPLTYSAEILNYQVFIIYISICLVFKRKTFMFDGNYCAKKTFSKILIQMRKLWESNAYGNETYKITVPF